MTNLITNPEELEFESTLLKVLNNKYAVRILEKLYFMLQPREDILPADWAEKYVYLSELVTNRPGMFSLVYTPYMREWLNNLADDTIQYQIFQKSAQIGFTLFIQVAVLWMIRNRPQPAIIAMPTDAMAKQFSEERMQHMIKACGPVYELLAKKRNAFKTLLFSFTTCALSLTGVGSAAKTSSKPAGFVAGDEVNKMLRKYRGESGAIQLLKHRTTSYEFTRQMLIGSTPTEEDGEIESEVQLGDCRYWRVKCPDCKGVFTFEWRDSKGNYNVTWDKDKCRDPKTKEWNMSMIRESAYYKCQCGFHINNSHRKQMISDGFWEPTKTTNDPRIRSYFINFMVGPGLTWGTMAVDFLNTIRKKGGAKDFDNSKLGLTTKWVTTDAPDLITLETLGGKYKLQQVEKDAVVITAIDVQSVVNGFWVVSRAYLPCGDTYLVDFQHLPTITECAMMARKYNSVLVGVDAGNGDDRQRVFGYCYDNGPHWIAMVAEEKMTTPFEPCMVDRWIGTKGKGSQLIPYVKYSHDIWNREIANARSGKLPGFYTHEGDVDAEYKIQMCNMYEAEIQNSDGSVDRKWKSKGDEHAFDCEKMNRVLFSVHIERFNGRFETDPDAKPAKPLAFSQQNEDSEEYGVVGSLYE